MQWMLLNSYKVIVVIDDSCWNFLVFFTWLSFHDLIIIIELINMNLKNHILSKIINNWIIIKLVILSDYWN